MFLLHAILDVRDILYVIMAKSVGWQKITVAQTLRKGCDSRNFMLLAQVWK
jgi:hypothetical protein